MDSRFRGNDKETFGIGEQPFVLVLVGPTGIGKTKLVLQLAKKFPIEVVSADSMQVYKGLDIGTAKPTRAERRRVKHHLIDLVGPSGNFSVYLFRKRALEAVRAIIKRDHVPVIVGGSGLYVRALLNGLTQYPKAHRGLRRRIEEEFKQKGLEPLYQRLVSLDSERASAIDRNNSRRIIRALEIATAVKATDGIGQKQPYQLPSLGELGYEYKVFGLTMKREDIYKRVEERIDSMFEKGWIAEAKRLAKKRLSRTVKQAIGYRQIWSSPIFQKRGKLSSGGFLRPSPPRPPPPKRSWWADAPLAQKDIGACPPNFGRRGRVRPLAEKRGPSILDSRLPARPDGWAGGRGNDRRDYERKELKSLSDSVKLATRHLVKKQFTWYYREPWIEWLDVTTENGWKKAEARLAEAINVGRASSPAAGQDGRPTAGRK